MDRKKQGGAMSSFVVRSVEDRDDDHESHYACLWGDMATAATFHPTTNVLLLPLFLCSVYGTPDSPSDSDCGNDRDVDNDVDILSYAAYR